MTLKEDKKLKDMATMTAGVTTSKLQAGATLSLHGHTVNIITTDAEMTIVQYGNKSDRIFDTPALNGYLDLGTFPVDTKLTRPTISGVDEAWIKAVSGDCCYQVFIVDNEGDHSQVEFTYAQLLEWHMAGPKNQPGRTAPGSLYVPKKTLTLSELNAKMDDAEPDDDTNPYEADLKTRITQLEADLAVAEITGQTRINDLTKENFSLKESIRSQKLTHDTVIAGYEQDIERLEAKAAILAPCKEYCTRYQVTDFTLNQLAREGWQVQHMQFIGVAGESQLNAVFFRDLPAAPAPQLLATDAAIYGPHIGAVSLTRPPVQRPPMPTNQTIIHQPTGRALTNNVSRITGETRRIPTLAELQDRKAANTAEINDIVQRGLDAHEALRKQYASSPRSFNVTGAQ